MILYEQVLQKIAYELKLSSEDYLVFSEYIRSTQLEILWKSIFSYFAEYAPLPKQRYIEILLEKLEDQTNQLDTLEKFGEVIADELNNNSKLYQHIVEKQSQYIVQFLENMISGFDFETAKEIVKLAHPHFNAIREYLIAESKKPNFNPKNYPFKLIQDNLS